MREGIVACPIHGDNETTSNCPNCRWYNTPYKVKRGNMFNDIKWTDQWKGAVLLLVVLVIIKLFILLFK